MGVDWSVKGKREKNLFIYVCIQLFMYMKLTYISIYIYVYDFFNKVTFSEKYTKKHYLSSLLFCFFVSHNILLFYHSFLYYVVHAAQQIHQNMVSLFLFQGQKAWIEKTFLKRECIYIIANNKDISR